MKNEIVGVVIVAVVALFVGGVIGAQIASPQLAPRLDANQAAPIVRAHSCDADGVCEVSPLRGPNGQNDSVQVLTNLLINEGLTAGGVRVGATELSPYRGTITSSWGSISQFTDGSLRITSAASKPISFRSTFQQEYDVKIFGGNITIPKLAGPLRAYACIDTDGTIYRKSSPCI